MVPYCQVPGCRMNGDIGLYEVWVVDPSPSFKYKGRIYSQGKARTCIHRLIVAAFSDKSAESMARFAAFQKLKKHPNEVYVSEIPGRVEAMGRYAIPKAEFEAFKKQCSVQSIRQEGEDA